MGRKKSRAREGSYRIIALSKKGSGAKIARRSVGQRRKFMVQLAKSVGMQIEKDVRERAVTEGTTQQNGTCPEGRRKSSPQRGLEPLKRGLASGMRGGGTTYKPMD